MMIIDLIKRMLVYQPNKRIKASDALTHPFFDDLRDKSFYDEINRPDLWNMT